jgi:hypothetical protein
MGQHYLACVLYHFEFFIHKRTAKLILISRTRIAVTVSTTNTDDDSYHSLYELINSDTIQNFLIIIPRISFQVAVLHDEVDRIFINLNLYDLLIDKLDLN